MKTLIATSRAGPASASWSPSGSLPASLFSASAVAAGIASNFTGNAGGHQVEMINVGIGAGSTT